jgi:hypothetical protein
MAVLGPAFDVELPRESRDRLLVAGIDAALQTLPGHYPVKRTRIHVQISEPFADNARNRRLAGARRSVNRDYICHLHLPPGENREKLYQNQTVPGNDAGRVTH